MIEPPYLNKGDKVAIVSTARKISKKELGHAVKVLENWGLIVVFGTSLFEEYYQFAGTDEKRAKDFQSALDDPTIKAIICARGGYGSVRIIDEIDFSNFHNVPKWIVGYSDVTVLHSHITNQINGCSIHGTMPINFESNTKEALDSLYSALFGKKVEYVLASNPKNRAGNSTGRLVGGNLSILYSLMGSPSGIDTRGCILFLEDLDEYLYHIDRMMLNLKRNGMLDVLSGLIVGAMSDMNDNPIPFGKSAEEIISDAVRDFDYPVVYGFPAGHIDDNRALYINKKANLMVGSSVSLSF